VAKTELPEAAQDRASEQAAAKLRTVPDPAVDRASQFPPPVSGVMAKHLARLRAIPGPRP